MDKDYYREGKNPQKKGRNRKMRKTMKDVMQMFMAGIYAADTKIHWYSKKREERANGPVRKAMWNLSKEFFAWDMKNVRKHIA